MNYEIINDGGVCTPAGFVAGVAKNAAILLSDELCTSVVISEQDIFGRYNSNLADVYGILVVSGSAGKDAELAGIAESAEDGLELPDNALYIASWNKDAILPVKSVLSGMDCLLDSADDDNGSEFATTVGAKEAAVIVHCSHGSYVIGASMSEQLLIITTDAGISSAGLKGILSDRGTAFILANGMSDIEIKSVEDKKLFAGVVNHLCEKLLK